MPPIAEPLREAPSDRIELIEAGGSISQSHVPVAESLAADSRRSPSFGYYLQLISVGLPLGIADVVATTLGLLLGLSVTLLVGITSNRFVPFAACVIMAKLLSFWSSGLYPGVGLHPARELQQLFRAALTSTFMLALGLKLVSDWMSPYLWMVVIGFPLELISLYICRSFVKSMMRHRNFGIPFYYLGSRQDVMSVYSDMSRFEWSMLRPVGRFAESTTKTAVPKAAEKKATCDENFERRFEHKVPYLGTPDYLPAQAKRNGVYWLVVVGNDPAPLVSQVSSGHLCDFPQIISMPATRTHACSGSGLINCGLASGVRVEEFRLLPWPRFVKRTLDVVVSGTALLLLLPLVIAIAFVIKLSSPGPIFFSHERIGRGGASFKAWKFRSMVSNAKEILDQYLTQHPVMRAEWERDHKLKNDPRTTAIGRLLRKTSLDELPQLWNVFVGEMSLVGPRPIVKAEIEKYGLTFKDYLRVTPGITGLWQISGRNNTTYAERLAYDSFYVRHWSPWLDLYILLRTVKTVILCEGAY